jgi:hypothetical protein
MLRVQLYEDTHLKGLMDHQRSLNSLSNESSTRKVLETELSSKMSIPQLVEVENKTNTGRSWKLREREAAAPPAGAYLFFDLHLHAANSNINYGNQNAVVVAGPTIQHHPVSSEEEESLGP